MKSNLGGTDEVMVSVVIATYNAAKYLTEAIECILNQTYRDLELIIVDDGSTDETPEVLRRYHDSRLVVCRNELNEGVARARNRGGRVATGKYLAIQDADDISTSDRLELQVEFLDGHPEIGVVGSQGWVLSGGMRTELNVPLDNDHIQLQLLGQNCMHHSSLMLRRDIYDRVQGYDESYEAALDLDLVLRLSEMTQLANLAERLYIKRSIPGSISNSRKGLIQKRNVLKAIDEAIIRRRASGTNANPHKIYARTCLAAACAEATFGESDRLQRNLLRANEIDPSIASDGLAALVISRHVVNYSAEPEARSNDPIELLDIVFKSWPTNRPVNPLKCRSQSLVFRDLAFSHFSARRSREVLFPAIRALIASRDVGNNRGLLSMSVRSCIRALIGNHS